MQVILIKEVDNLGGKHELVNVKNGYARNFLIPQKFAIEANPTNLKLLKEKQKVQARKEEKLLAEINEVKTKLTESPITVGAKVGTSGKIFGTITSVQLSRSIREQKGYEIDRRRITILDEVKEPGTHKASIDFGHGNITELKFEVVAE